MDDEFSDLFLLNDCLISGRLSPGPPDAPDDFLGQGSYGGLLIGASGHNGEMPANFMCFDGEPDLSYTTSESPRRSSIGTTVTLMRPAVTSNGGVGLFTYIKTENASRPLSPSAKSPDHDYINEVKVEGLPVENGVGSGYGTGICLGKTASSMDYCHGTIENGSNDDGITVKYDVDEYYTDTVEAKQLRAGSNTRIISSSHPVSTNPMVGIGGVLFTNGVTSAVITAAPDASRLGVGESNGDNLAAKSMDAEAWPCGPVLPRGDDDGIPSGDDNSSTTSGDSCSNCGYLSSGSPAPVQKHGSHAAYSSHHQGNGLHRYRSSNSSAASALNLNLRTRSKMHELALKHNLISEQDPRSKGYVLLSTEERRTLIQEGLPVPAKLPLSKQEEEALKIVRRKIKNKLSAQESRRKRKEYMETLEQQIDGYQSENTSLRRRIETLEKTNQSLLGQLKKLQQQLSPTGSPTSATALIIGSNHGDGSATTRGSSNVHHTVSLAAVFLLFAVMIPAMPIWPSVFRNAFIASPMMTKPSDIDTSVSDAYFDHSSNIMGFPASRVLWSGGGGDCEIPYSAEYFEKLNECRQDDPVKEGKPTTEESHSTLVYSAVVNFTEKSERISGHEGFLPQNGQVSSTAVCETSACREVLGSSKTVATA